MSGSWVLFSSELKRLLRGWRWRGLLAATILGAWWFSRGEGFGVGSSVFFPGGAAGANAFPIVALLAAFSMGMESAAVWQRHRASILQAARVLHPVRLVALRWLAGLVALLPLLALFVLWPSIGVWRVDLPVLWAAPLAYLGTVVAPLAMIGLLLGNVLRQGIARIAWLYLVALPALGLLLWWRLEALPPADLFRYATPRIGLLAGDRFFGEALIVSLGALLGGLALAPWTYDGREGRSVIAGLVTSLRTRPLAGVATTALIATSITLLIGPLSALRFRPMIDQPPPSVPGATTFKSRKLSIQQDSLLHRIEATLEVYGADRALVTFGPYLQPEQSLQSGVQGDVRWHLLPVEDGVARATLRPTAEGVRAHGRAFHRLFHQPSLLGPWWGESLSTLPDSTLVQRSQSTPLSVTMAPEEGLRWVLPDGRISDGIAFTSATATGLESLVASPVDYSDRPTTFALRCLFDNERTELIAALPVIHQEATARVLQLFGSSDPITIVEVPLEQSMPGLVLSSAELDLLETILPNFDDFERPTADQFHGIYAQRLHRSILERAHHRRLRRLGERAFLDAALLDYLHTVALSQGFHHGLLERTRRVLPMEPWSWRELTRRPFDVSTTAADAWIGPVLGIEAPEAPGNQQRRLLAVHHMLRGVMGDVAFAQLVAESAEDGELDRSRWERHATRLHGKSLDWFFRQWLDVGVLPQYEIRRGQAFLLNNATEQTLEYRVEAELENRGTGRMPVPWRLVTEGENLTGTIWLAGGESAPLTLSTLDRPVALELDPDGWIAQRARDKDDGPTPFPRIVFKAISELR